MSKLKDKNDKDLRFKTNGFSAKEDKLIVREQILLSFSKCDVTSHPTSKRDFQEIINTLAAFVTDEKMSARGKHKLTKKDIGKNSDKISCLIDKYEKVCSLDVYHRGGSKGNTRLLYSLDEDNANVAYILDCFIDTH